jgi:7,8-dihydropterin-6-yl-methyl-4-(beta-D-ribofuranosyl)aminobenzene 5'-phosphate synthase
MKKLEIDPRETEEIVISHYHRDHTGGLSDLLDINPVTVYVPSAYRGIYGEGFIVVNQPTEIREDVFPTGELKRVEQSLYLKTQRGLVVIAGCSHPGVRTILEGASQFGKPLALIGGLHGFRDFNVVEDLELICAAHCTQFKSEISSLYPEK